MAAPGIAQKVTIDLGAGQSVSGLWRRPAKARACAVRAHGGVAGMAHRSMAELADGLAEREVATLRYAFSYVERGSKRPDLPAVAHTAVRAACSKAAALAGALALYAGGKSFGGRMTSQAQAAAPLPGVRGLVFLGFPLHPPGQPSDERGKHLFDVHLPMLFLQGTRDEFANLELLKPLTEQLGARATLKLFPDADHSFHVPARTGRNDLEVRNEVLDAMADWIE